MMYRIVSIGLLSLLLTPCTTSFSPTRIIASSRSTTRLYLDDADEQEDQSRRDFFQQSLLTVPAMAAAVTTNIATPALAQETVSAAAAASSVNLPPIGLGAWAWGDSLFWGYDPKNDEELRKVFNYAIAKSRFSTTLLDTAEVYGFGRSESLIGEFSKAYPPEKVTVATKFAAYPFRTKPQDVVKACEASLKRLGGRPIDLYQIHFPNAWSNAEYWDGLAMACDKGLVKSVGVSNYGVDAMRACHAALAKRGIPLATNQIQLSLLYKFPLENGLKQACDDLGVKILSYSPLGLGLLTGKYSPESPPKGPRKAIYDQLIKTPDYDNLLATMKEVADDQTGKSSSAPPAALSQVALNWCRAKGTIPIPGARTLSQIEQNYGALDWNLSDAQVAALDKASAKVTSGLSPDASPFAKKDINTGLVMFDS